ncbi:uncharacterized protein [Argopecten irradians]|uniref:uncharacterized protein n=1 Tax=Argopecten irradians TaxID=31199 RepID=UPI00371CCDE1
MFSISHNLVSTMVTGTLMFCFFLFHVGLSTDINKRILLSDPNYVHQLEVKLEELTSKVESVTSANQQLTSKVDSVTSANQQLHAKIDIVTNTNQQLTNENQELTKKIDNVTNENHQLNAKVDNINNANQQLNTKLDQVTTKLNGLPTGESGGVYTRWGRKSCPNNADLVYQGYTGGSWYDYSGAAADHLCMPKDPQYEPDALIGSFYGNVYGTEYEDVFFGHVSNSDDVPCAVCRSTVGSNVLMIPGRNTCYQGWYHEYNGYLAAGPYGYKGATEYVCLDHDPESLSHGNEDRDGALLYYVTSMCGSLACPPYVNEKTLSCVVCSK